MLAGQCIESEVAGEIADLAMAAYAEDRMADWFVMFHAELLAGAQPLRAATLALDEVRS